MQLKCTQTELADVKKTSSFTGIIEKSREAESRAMSGNSKVYNMTGQRERKALEMKTPACGSSDNSWSLLGLQYLQVSVNRYL